MFNNYNILLRQLVGSAIFTSILATSAFAVEESCRDQSETRFALVIGNSYSGRLSGRLDAEKIAEHLCELRFSVDLYVDASFFQVEGDLNEDSDGALGKFRQKIWNAKEVVFFYSGHGYQIGGKNYLLPNDQAFNSRNPQIPLSRIMWALKGAPNKAVKIIFLDACRSLTGPAIKGLAETHDLPPSTLVSFATEYNQTTPSGRGDQLSPYAAVLARSIREPGLGIYRLLARMTQELGVAQIPQTPIYQLNDFPGFIFKEAIKLRLEIEGDLNDQLFVFHNDTLAFTASTEDDPQGGRSKTLELEAGDNKLSVLIYNGKDFQDRQPWRPTDGWKYRMKVDWPAGTEKDCADPCFEGSEEIPFKSGPHHGQIFEVARATIHVDPGTGLINAGVDNDVWKEGSHLWASEQKILWSKSFNLLNLGERTSFKQLLRIFGSIKEVLRASPPTKGVNLPKLEDLFAQVYGNDSLLEPVEFCMDEKRQDRLDDLEAGLKVFLDHSFIRPFDEFDRNLSKCVEEWVSLRPEHPFFNQEVRVWTAFQEIKPESPKTPPGNPTSPGVTR